MYKGIKLIAGRKNCYTSVALNFTCIYMQNKENSVSGNTVIYISYLHELA